MHVVTCGCTYILFGRCDCDDVFLFFGCGCVNKHLRVLCIPRLVSGTTLGET